MGFLGLLIVASMPVLRVLLIAALGALLASQRVHVLTADALKHLNKVAFLIFMPALMFASLAQTVTLQSLISWWYMPFNVLLTFLFGAIFGWILVKLTKPPEHLKGLIVANCSTGNLGNLPIIIVPAMCQEEGSPFGERDRCMAHATAYASFSMALGSIFIWTYTYSLIKSASQIYEGARLESGTDESIPNKDYLNARETSSLLQTVQIIPDVSGFKGDNEEVVLPSSSPKQSYFQKIQQCLKGIGYQIFEEILTPPTAGSILGFIVGAISQVKALIVGPSAPLRLIQDSVTLLGNGTIPSITLILGGNLTKGFGSSKVRPIIIVGIVCVRFLFLPIIGIFIVRGASYLGLLPADPLYHFVLMLQFSLPAAMAIGTMTQFFSVGEQECSVILLWTYAVAACATTFWSTVYMHILFG